MLNAHDHTTSFLSAASRASRKRIFSPQKKENVILEKNKNDSASRGIVKVYEDINDDESDTLIPCRSRRHRPACLPPRQSDVTTSMATNLGCKSTVHYSNPNTTTGDFIYWESQEYDEVEMLTEDVPSIALIDAEAIPVAVAAAGVVGAKQKSKNISDDQNLRHLREHSKENVPINQHSKAIENVPTNQQSKAIISTKSNFKKEKSDGTGHVASNIGSMSRGQRQNIQKQNSFLNLSALRTNSVSVSVSVSDPALRNKLTFVPVPQTFNGATTLPVSRQIVKQVAFKKPVQCFSDSGNRGSKVYSPLTGDSRAPLLSLPRTAEFRSGAISLRQSSAEHSAEHSEKNHDYTSLNQFLSVEKNGKKEQNVEALEVEVEVEVPLHRVWIRKHPINAPKTSQPLLLSSIDADRELKVEEQKNLPEEQASSAEEEVEVEVEVVKTSSVRHITVFAASQLEKLKHDTWELHLSHLLKRSRERTDRVRDNYPPTSSSDINMLLNTLTLSAVDKRGLGVVEVKGEGKGEVKGEGEGEGGTETENLPVCLSNRPRGTHGVYSEAVSGMRYCVHEVVGKGAFGYAVLATATATAIAPTLSPAISAAFAGGGRGYDSVGVGVGVLVQSRARAGARTGSGSGTGDGAGSGIRVGKTGVGAGRGSKRRGEEHESPLLVHRSQGTALSFSLLHFSSLSLILLLCD